MEFSLANRIQEQIAWGDDGEGIVITELVMVDDVVLEFFLGF